MSVCPPTPLRMRISGKPVSPGGHPIVTTPSTMGEMDSVANFKRVRFVRVLILSWLAYVAYLVGRKPTSVARVELNRLGLSTFTLGLIDTAFLTTYSFGQLFYSVMDHRFTAKVIISVGLIGSAICVSAFTFSSFAPFLVTMWGLNGLLQSLGWPSCIKTLTPWVGSRERGWVMGIWSSNQSVGGVVGNVMISFLMGHFGWRTAFVMCSLTVALVAVSCYLFLVDHPKHVMLSIPAELTGDSVETKAELVRLKEEEETLSNDSEYHPPEQRLTLWTTLAVPGILGLSMSYFCQKIIRYSLLFWLPFYICKILGYDQIVAGYTSSAFDLGGAIGTILSGIASDYFQGGKRRVTMCTWFLVFLVVFLLAFSAFEAPMKNSITITVILSGMLGFFSFSCDSLITGPIIQDISERSGIYSQASTLSGVVGGIGSLGAILQGTITATLAETMGWAAVFYGLVILGLFSIVSMVHPLIYELKTGVTPASASGSKSGVV